MKVSIFVTGARFVDFVNDKKDKITGVSLEYIDSCEPHEDEDGRILGYQSCKCFLPENLWDKLRVVPGYYMGDYDIITRRGKRDVVLRDLEYMPAAPNLIDESR